MKIANAEKNFMIKPSLIFLKFIIIISFLQVNENLSFSEQKPFEYIVKQEVEENIKEVFYASRVLFSPATGVIGSGIILHQNNWLITAKHVTDGLFNYPQSATIPPPIVIGPKGEVAEITKVIVLKEGNIDLSLVKLVPIIGKNTAAKIPRNPTQEKERVVYGSHRIGRKIGLIGTFSSSRIVDNSNTNVQFIPMLKEGVISNHDAFGGVYFYINANVVQGDSGGPVFDMESGEILGVVVEINTQLFESSYPRKFNPKSVDSMKEMINFFRTTPPNLIKEEAPFTFKVKVEDMMPINAKVVPTFYIKVILNSEGLLN